jgi:hypothetical protein
MVTCPHCAEEIKEGAQVCPHCRKRVKPHAWRNTAIAVAICLGVPALFIALGPVAGKLWRDNTSDEAAVERAIRANAESNGYTVDKVEMHYVGVGKMRGTLHAKAFGFMPVVKTCEAEGTKWKCD